MLIRRCWKRLRLTNVTWTSRDRSSSAPLDIAREIQARIREELSLPCSVGIAPNKLLAKMASDMKKPNGLSVLRIRDVLQVLWNRPCAELFGIGSKTADKLRKLNIHTIGQLAAADEGLLTSTFGVMGSWMKRAPAASTMHLSLQGGNRANRSDTRPRFRRMLHRRRRREGCC